MFNVKKIEQSIPSHFGHVQKSVISDLLKYRETAELNSYMKAKKRYTNYCMTIEKAINWLKSQGLKIQYVPGERGGAWTAHYKLD